MIFNFILRMFSRRPSPPQPAYLRGPVIEPDDVRVLPPGPRADDELTLDDFCQEYGMHHQLINKRRLKAGVERVGTRHVPRPQGGGRHAHTYRRADLERLLEPGEGNV